MLTRLCVFNPTAASAWVAAPIVAGIVILMGTCGFLFFVIHRRAIAAATPLMPPFRSLRHHLPLHSPLIATHTSISHDNCHCRRERKGTPVFTRLEAEGTRRQGLQEFASSEESKGGDAGRISDPPRYAASSPRTPNNNV